MPQNNRFCNKVREFEMVFQSSFEPALNGLSSDAQPGPLDAGSVSSSSSSTVSNTSSVRPLNDDVEDINQACYEHVNSTTPVLCGHLQTSPGLDLIQIGIQFLHIPEDIVSQLERAQSSDLIPNYATRKRVWSLDRRCHQITLPLFQPVPATPGIRKPRNLMVGSPLGNATGLPFTGGDEALVNRSSPSLAPGMQESLATISASPLSGSSRKSRLSDPPKILNPFYEKWPETFKAGSKKCLACYNGEYEFIRAIWKRVKQDAAKLNISENDIEAAEYEMSRYTRIEDKIRIMWLHLFKEDVEVPPMAGENHTCSKTSRKSKIMRKPKSKRRGDTADKADTSCGVTLPDVTIDPQLMDHDTSRPLEVSRQLSTLSSSSEAENCDNFQVHTEQAQGQIELRPGHATVRPNLHTHYISSIRRLLQDFHDPPKKEESNDEHRWRLRLLHGVIGLLHFGVDNANDVLHIGPPAGRGTVSVEDFSAWPRPMYLSLRDHVLPSRALQLLIEDLNESLEALGRCAYGASDNTQRIWRLSVLDFVVRHVRSLLCQVIEHVGSLPPPGQQYVNLSQISPDELRDTISGVAPSSDSQSLTDQSYSNNESLTRSTTTAATSPSACEQASCLSV